MTGVTLQKAIKRYGATQVIHGVDLTIEDGEFCVFVGPSGCGKSTLLRMIAGLEETSDGQINIGARDVTHMDPAERGVAMVFQTYALYPHMTVEENMGFGLKMNGVDKAEIKRKVDGASKILKLDDYLKRKPAALSGGQRQRVAIGRSIVRGPEVFLFDEPLSNLDAELRVDMRVEIARLHKELGTTMIYVTHDQVEAMTLADKIVVLRAGYIEQVGSPMHLYQDPDNKFVAGFIGSPAMNFVKGVVEDGGVRVPGLADRVIPTSVSLPATGSEVTVGVRPQDMALDQGTSPIKLDIRERLGGVAYDYLTTPTGERLIVESRGDMAMDEGTEVTVSFEDDRVMFFDATSEQRLR
ncbi:sn-glycerol-3-phosphate ABC transporter ATP-binding protein UgpC [uncultured Tateyamaria sp.]|uniref:ABC transporter ATP-binding protein n=1 Tax=uncultured Tateyamaria sp. TaxID=455651 RepID=UPI00262EF12A|nr:sn-glycerol-3-phosphate ABC transporter ATP-binding protein UgpC [uncultured Tateyamaria sp.]